MRFAPRHVHETVVQFVTAQLATDGWTGSTINFGTTEVEIQAFQPDLGQSSLPDGNLVAISLGSEPPNMEEELGGAVESIDFVVFLDVIGTNESIAVSIASDLKDALRNTITPVLDFTTSTPATTDHFIEFLDVEVETPQAALGERRRWRVVKTMAHTVFNG